MVSKVAMVKCEAHCTGQRKHPRSIPYPPEDIPEPLLFNGSLLLKLDAHECVEPYF